MIKNKIVSSAYKLNYISDRGGGGYKGIDLLVHTIKNIVFDEFEYVIYTNKQSYEHFGLEKIFHQPNVTIKFRELNSYYYTEILKPIKDIKNQKGEIWDRIFSVDNYIEVILNKIDFVLEESKNFEGNVVWIDAGLFGTSCSNAWRDYMSLICHTKNFVDKIFEKVENYEFISLKGNHILMGYVIREKLNSMINQNTFIIPGALFGGTSQKNIEYLSKYKELMNNIIEVCGEYTSEQELLYLLLYNKKVNFFEFDDWDDFQKGILKIMDIYEENKYLTNSMEHYGVIIKSNDNSNSNITHKLLTKEEIKDLGELDFTQIADLFGTDKGNLHEGHLYTKMYEKYLSKFKNECPVIVEIGLNDSRFPGGCLKFWDMIFDNMKYHGIDIQNCSHLNYNHEKITIHQYDQGDESQLHRFIEESNISGKIDIIIDDGSHIMEDILVSLKNLYPHLKSGGFYIIESIHAGQSNKDILIPLIEEYLFTMEHNNIEFYRDKMLIITK